MNYPGSQQISGFADGINANFYGLGRISQQSLAPYTGRGDRVQQIFSSSENAGQVFTTTYTLDLAIGLTQVLADDDNTYLYGLNRIGQEGTDGWIYHHSDALGSVRQLTDADGAVVFSQSYQPYGEVLSSVGSKFTDYGFTGEWTDTSGLVYLRARYYSPGDGRFLSKDIWDGDPNQPMSYNPWLYAYANPIMLTDPSGMIPQPEHPCDRLPEDDAEFCRIARCMDEDDWNEYWKEVILSKYGITLRKGDREWDAKSIKYMKLGLGNIDRILMGNTKRFGNGATFYLNSEPPGYYGGTTYSAAKVVFRTASTVPYQNLYHEFGHVMNFEMSAAISNFLGKKAHYINDTYVFGGDGKGEIDHRLVLKNKDVSDPVWGQDAIDALQHPSTGPIEQWADIFANGVAGNIDAGKPGGKLMGGWLALTLMALTGGIPPSP